MLVSTDMLDPAAWGMTGSVNYLWPAALGLYGMLAFAETRNRRPLARFACLLASGLAMYNEHVELVLLPAALMVRGMLVAQRRGPRWDVEQVAFMLANAGEVFGAPGLQRRRFADQHRRFRAFNPP